MQIKPKPQNRQQGLCCPAFRLVLTQIRDVRVRRATPCASSERLEAWTTGLVRLSTSWLLMERSSPFPLSDLSNHETPNTTVHR